MAINVNNREADSLTREFADMEGVGISQAIVIAMREALDRRGKAKTSLQAVARLCAKHGIAVPIHSRKPLAKSIYDAM